MSSGTISTDAKKPLRPAVPVFVATTVMLSFISFWRAAAIVLNDMGSSAFYAGAIAEHFIGKTAPWFILAIMLLSFAVRSIYIESCSMFVRGGVYRVVKEAMGSTLAKFSVSALMFDYILTGPISGVSAGLYLTGLLNEFLRYAHSNFVLPMNWTAAFFAALVTIYFWWQNIKGIPESSEKALRIMYVTTVMVVLMIVWCVYTLSVRGAHFPSWPRLSNLVYSDDALGWLRHTSLPYTVGLIGILIGLGHSVLAMSGEETMAQVYREIEHPKLRNLEKAGFVIFLYSLIFTAGVAFFAVMIIPDSVRNNYFDNPIGGLAMYLVGPLPLRLVFRGFVVVVGVLMLAGAVNTAIVGSNGVLNRISEDGILPQWFRHPHPRFGTPHRILNLVVGLQLLTILLSRGNIFILGEAYAFGVMWSFAMKGLAVLVLRYKQPGVREFRVPLNLKFRNLEIPLGLSLITIVLFALCLINLFTKQNATVAGVTFSAIFFTIFAISEHLTAKRAQGRRENIDQFRVYSNPELNREVLQVRPGNILVGVRDPRNLGYLREVLATTDTSHQDVVVMTARLYHREPTFSGNRSLDAKDIFDDYEQELFTSVVNVAEKEGKPVSLLVAAGTNVFDTIMLTAQSLQSSRVVSGFSNKLTPDEQGKLTGDAWERLPGPKPRLVLELKGPGQPSKEYRLGPHSPRLRPQDLQLLHALWLEITKEPQYSGLHHYHIVAFALRKLQQALHGGRRDQLLAELGEEESNPRDDVDES